MTNNNETEQQDWLANRKLILGASEISPAMRTTLSEEEIKEGMGESAQDFMESKDFLTPYELYHLKKGTLEGKPFPKVPSKFGHAMEKFGEMWLNKKYGDYIKAECQPQKVTKSDLHKLAGCTFDLFAKFLKDDENFRGVSVEENDRCVVEVKTTGFFQAMKEKLNDNGSKWAYIQQVQYQGMQENARDPRCKWTMLLHIIPLEADFDDDYTKGQAVMACANIENGGYEWLLKHYDVNFWIFPIFESLHPLFMNTLNRWDNMLQNDIEPEPDFLRDKSSVSKILKQHLPEIKSNCKIKYGIDDGCIPIAEFKDSNINAYDEAKIFYEKSSELKQLIDDVDIQKTKFFSAFKQAGILGIDDDRFTIKVGLAGSGVGIKCQFKNYEEMQSGSVAKDKF